MEQETPDQLDTPAMRQYKAFKAQHPGYLLLFRMGDFYETFYEDAKEASRILGIALTARSKGANAVPLAGIPFHALDSYLSRLIKAGCRVAICEQVEDPKLARGLVKRDVVRLMTPGTLTEEELLDQRQGNYLAAIFIPEKSGAVREKAGNSSGKTEPGEMAGLAWVELSSGGFWTMLVQCEHVMDELVRIGPAEVIFPEGGRFDSPAWRDSLRQAVGATPTSRPAWAFDARSAMQALNEHFETKTLEGFGFEKWDESVSAAGAIIDYLKETQRTAIGHILSLRRFDRRDHMAIDANTLRCLEVLRTLRCNSRSGSLLACVDKTCTGMGARRLEQWLSFPLTGYSQILARHDAVEELSGDRCRLTELRQAFQQVGQIDRIAANVAMGRVRPRELVTLGISLGLLPEICRLMEGAKAELLAGISPQLSGLGGPVELIARAVDPDCPNVLRDGGVIAKGYDAELDRLRRIGSDGQSWLADYQAQQIQQTGIGNLKVGFNQVFGYYIEITNSHTGKAPASYVRKQTLKNAERYITDELKRYEGEVLTAEERAKKLESQIFEQVRQELLGHIPAIQAAAGAVADLDVLAALAALTVERGYVRPAITQDCVLEIAYGKHPVLAEQLREQFVPNDVKMDGQDNRLLIITGPNMAGKSTYIRQTALLVLMAQAGSFIPARSAVIGLADRIFTRVGAADELARGLSTFMLEMVETANILNNATGRSLVILDEVGRGTSTSDGLALAWAVCEHIALRIKCRTMFATHYHELTELEELLDGTKNLNVAVREWADQVVFLHKIVEGGTDQSYGVHVARLAGVPKEVIERARTLLPQLQAHLAKGLDMPALAQRAKAAAAQMDLFADPASRIAAEIKSADLENMTPLQALDLLRKLKSEL
ncbi:MAG: DNA mismatch repair protein MutS [Planctomycetes bacterium]|nr:DNA mismatch repair protein MutS [Planctomycetota bacterium]